MTDVFISYSRKDAEFGRRLYTALIAHDWTVWMDWSDIPQTAIWWQEITNGIAHSDNFLFLISEDSIASPICNLEIECARLLNKRIVPVLVRETDVKKAHVALIHQELTEFQDSLFQGHDLLAIARDNWQRLGGVNWVAFEKEAEFNTCVDELINALDVDIEYVHEHTRLLNRAQDWENRRKLPSLLLFDDDLLQAEEWLNRSVAKSKHPLATELQRSYIHESRLEQTRVTTETRRIQLDRYQLSLRQLLSLRFFGAFLGNWISFGYLVYYQSTIYDPHGWFVTQNTITGISVGTVLGLGFALVIMLATDGRLLFYHRQWYIGWLVSIFLCILVFIGYRLWVTPPVSFPVMVITSVLFTSGFALASLRRLRDVVRATVSGFGVFIALYLPFVGIGSGAVFNLTDVPVYLLVIFATLIGFLTFLPEFLGLRQKAGKMETLSRLEKGDIR